MREGHLSGPSLCLSFSNFRFGVSETGSTCHRDRFAEPTLGIERDAGIKSAVPEDNYCRSLTLRSCSGHEYGSALARPVTVRSAGALLSTIAAMMRGDTKARGASRRPPPAKVPVLRRYQYASLQNNRLLIGNPHDKKIADVITR
jgi:hypothetical protein